MNLSPLLWQIGIILALVVTLVLFEIFIHWYDNYRIKNGIEEDRSLKNTFSVRYHKVPHSTFRILFEGGLFLAIGVMCLFCYSKFSEYKQYGAFYDNSWKMQDVESHFLYESTDTEFLNELYLSNPDTFDPTAYNVCLIKFGCKECEEMKEYIDAINTENIYLVYSRSDVGKFYVDHYGIQYVPCVVFDGSVIPLYTPDSFTPSEPKTTTPTDTSVGADTVDMIDQLSE